MLSLLQLVKCNWKRLVVAKMNETTWYQVTSAQIRCIYRLKTDSEQDMLHNNKGIYRRNMITCLCVSVCASCCVPA